MAYENSFVKAVTEQRNKASDEAAHWFAVANDLGESIKAKDLELKELTDKLNTFEQKTEGVENET
jgi:hypothetical protein